MTNINIGKKELIHFIGIGGIGMSGLAQIMKIMNFKVQGSDLGKNKNTENCRKIGVKVFVGHAKKNLSQATIVVKSTAITKRNVELMEAKKKKLPIYERAEMLANIVALKKNRDRKTGRINIVTAKVSVKDRDLILVDDMISTGGSIIKATQFLKKQKCRRVYVVCTHGLFVNGAEKKIKQAGVTQIISTNTIPSNSSKVDVSKILAESLL